MNGLSFLVMLAGGLCFGGQGAKQFRRLDWAIFPPDYVIPGHVLIGMGLCFLGMFLWLRSLASSR